MGIEAEGEIRFGVQIDDEFSVTAIPDEGYRFTGWYRGEYLSEDADGNPIQDARPYLDDENLLSTDLTYSFTVTDNTVICPVFQAIAANSMKIAPKTATVKYSKLKKKAQRLAVTKPITFQKKAGDKKNYSLVSAKKGKKSFKKCFKVGETTGKLTIKKTKKMKKGTYKVRIKVRALGMIIIIHPHGRR